LDTWKASQQTLAHLFSSRLGVIEAVEKAAGTRFTSLSRLAKDWLALSWKDMMCEECKRKFARKVYKRVVCFGYLVIELSIL
jgi:hypothetical protein